MKSTSKLDLAFFFSSTLNDKFSGSHLDIWVPNIIIEGFMKKIQLKQHFSIVFEHLTHKIMALAYIGAHFLHTWPCLLPIMKLNPLYTRII